MPAPGDQHKLNGAATTNPFEEHKPHISEYTAQEIATLQSRLNKRLGPEFLSTRPGPGNQKIPYLSAEKAINLANEVFGFNGWSTSIQNIQIDFVDENSQTGKVSLGLSVVVRVTLKDGTYHEDIGYGGIDNCKGKAMAFEKSKKEATTDALKRALRNFGNVLGNCVYDKDYVTKVSKIKAGNGRFDLNELHRHPDYMPKTIEDGQTTVQNAPATTDTPSLVFEDSFDVSEFDDFDFNENDLSHSEEVFLPAESAPHNTRPGARPGMTAMNTPSKAPQPGQNGRQPSGYSRPPIQQPGLVNGTIPGPLNRSGFPTERPAQIPGLEAERSDGQRLSSPGVPSQHFAAPPGQGTTTTTGSVVAPTAGFYSAKAAKNIDTSNLSSLPPNASKFNPHAESPSIRKTAGVDHTKSIPVRKELQKAEPIVTPNIVDPRGDLSRKIGVPGPPIPGVIGRPTMSTSAYRPPTRNASPATSGPTMMGGYPSNPADRGLTAAKRPPLGDVSNVQHAVTALTADGVDAKRQKTGPSGAISGGLENGPGSNVTGPG